METAPVRVGWMLDDDLGLEWLRDVDAHGWWSRCGRVFIERLGDDRHAIWVRCPWVDETRSLFGEYVGPPELGNRETPLARWFPGTTAPGHHENPRARWHARFSEVERFAVAKREATRLLCAIAAHADYKVR